MFLFFNGICMSNISIGPILHNVIFLNFVLTRNSLFHILTEVSFRDDTGDYRLFLQTGLCSNLRKHLSEKAGGSNTVEIHLKPFDVQC